VTVSQREYAPVLDAGHTARHAGDHIPELRVVRRKRGEFLRRPWQVAFLQQRLRQVHLRLRGVNSLRRVRGDDLAVGLDGSSRFSSRLLGIDCFLQLFGNRLRRARQGQRRP